MEILLNLRWNKTEIQIIESLSHELAHIVLGNEHHGVDHSKEWKKLEEEITKKYWEE